MEHQGPISFAQLRVRPVPTVLCCRYEELIAGGFHRSGSRGTGKRIAMSSVMILAKATFLVFETADYATCNCRLMPTGILAPRILDRDLARPTVASSAPRRLSFS